MDDSTKLGLGILAGTAVVAGAAILLTRRRGDGRGAPLAGAYSSSIKKFQDRQGREDIAVVSWSLPPGPPHPAGAREGFRELCSKVGGSKGLAKVPLKGGMKDLRRDFGQWWEYGTCPGCSEMCAVACYPSKKSYPSSISAQRAAYANVCDMAEGKGLPEIRVVDCEGDPKADSVCSVRSKSGVRVDRKGDGPLDADVVVDPRKVSTMYVRVHVAGDFFDVEYAKQWQAEAKRQVARYNRELRDWHEGKRRTPPMRVLFWAYTRAWRIGDPKGKPGAKVGRPDPQMLDAIRSFPLIRYPREVYPKWHSQAGQMRRPEREAFGLLLSADSQTGVPWVKDKLGRIMPVSFLLTATDLATLTPDGQAAIAEWDKKIPGMILRDHSLRKFPRDGLSAFKDPALRWCPAEVTAAPGVDEEGEEGQKGKKGKKGKKGAKEKSGCFSCGLCLGGTAQGVAEHLFKRFMLAGERGIDPDKFVNWEKNKRGDPIPDPGAEDQEQQRRDVRIAAAEEYEAWRADRRAPIFKLAVPPSELIAPDADVSERARRQMDIWLERKAERIPLVGEKG